MHILKAERPPRPAEQITGSVFFLKEDKKTGEVERTLKVTTSVQVLEPHLLNSVGCRGERCKRSPAEESLFSTTFDFAALLESVREGSRRPG